ncbi:MAG: ABC transporter permease [Caloramator sp.]|nr:ABC transporter permease [Caloramator sp.]
MNYLKKYFNNVYKGRYILINLVKQDLKNKYRNSILGFAWTFLTPLGLVLIIGSVYSIVFGQPMKEFIPFLFSGLIPWIYLSSCAEGGTTSLIIAQGYIKQTQTPIEIFPIRIALVSFVNLLFSIIAFFLVYIFIKPEKISLNMITLIPALLVMLIFGCMWATLVSVINVYIRDFAPLQSLLLQALFYITPIIYPPKILASKNYEWVYLLNPLYYLLEVIRRSILGEKILNNNIWAISIFIIIFSMLLSIYIIEKVGRKITFKL